MRGQVRKWGNSASVRIPASILAATALRIDQEVDIREEEGRIVIEPVAPRAFDLDALLDAMTPETFFPTRSISDRRSVVKPVMADYVPDAGDIVWLRFDPQAGHEQAGHRPALVLTPARYNGLRGMMICCPMISRIKGYVFEVVESRSPDSAILADQVKSLDWRARKAVKKGEVSAAALAEARLKIKSLLGL